MNETIGGNEQQSPEEIFRAQFADAIDKVEEAIEKNPLDPTELETLEQSLHTSYIGYSESVRKTATAVELNDKITHLENLGTKIEEIINSSDGSASIELNRIIACLNGPRMDFEQQLLNIGSSAEKEPFDSTKAA